MNIVRRIGCGVVQGLFAWSSYAVVEYALFTVGGLLFIQDAMITSWLHRIFLQLLAAYLVLGAVSGGIFAMLLYRGERRSDIPRFQGRVLRAATLSVALAFLLQNVLRLCYSGVSPQETVALVSGVLLYFLLGLSLRESSRIGSSPFLRGPWTPSVILLGPPWLVENLSQSFYLSALVLVVLLAGALFLDKIRDPAGSAGIARPFVAQTAAACAVVVLVLAWNPPPPSFPQQTAGGQQSADLPNVVFVVMDTVRADHLSLYGYERTTTPRLSDLSDEFSVFSRGIAVSDHTVPTHVTMFTGLYPAQHGAHCSPETYDQPRPLDRSIPVLAEFLRDQGYVTIGLSANHFNVNSTVGLDRGFDVFRQPDPIAFGTGYSAIRHLVREVLHKVVSTLEFDRSFISAADLNAGAFSVLDGAPQSSSPFFLFLNYMDAHTPYIPPAPFDTAFPGKLPRDSQGQYLEMVSAVHSLQSPIQRELRAHYISQYDGGIAYLDAQVGRLMDHLKALNLYEQSLIIITADHGEAFGDKHNLVGHGVSVYQDVVHVPLLVKLPGQTKGERVDNLVSQVDVLPTILDVLGLDWPDDLPGTSIYAPDRQRDAYSQYFACQHVLENHPRFRRDQWAVISGSDKLVVSSNREPEFYDLFHDPLERNNLYAEQQQAAAVLAGKLMEWKTYVAHNRVESREIDPEQLKKLKSLGYLQ